MKLSYEDLQAIIARWRAYRPENCNAHECADELEAALAQQAQPEGAAWMQATCNNGGTVHLFMAYVRSGESIPHLCNEHKSQ